MVVLVDERNGKEGGMNWRKRKEEEEGVGEVEEVSDWMKWILVTGGKARQGWKKKRKRKKRRKNWHLLHFYLVLQKKKKKKKKDEEELWTFHCVHSLRLGSFLRSPPAASTPQDPLSSPSHCKGPSHHSRRLLSLQPALLA